MRSTPKTASSGAAAAALAVVVGCASPEVIPVFNKRNVELNADGPLVTGSIDKLNQNSIRALAASAPVCIAYQLPRTTPALNPTFKRSLAEVAATLDKTKGQRTSVTIYQAQRKGGINAIAELVALKKEMPASYQAGQLHFEPMAPPEFRAQAKCPGKETILIAGSEILFYREELPLATLGAGEMPIDSVLFLVLDHAKVEQNSAQTATRSPS